MAEFAEHGPNDGEDQRTAQANGRVHRDEQRQEEVERTDEPEQSAANAADQ